MSVLFSQTFLKEIKQHADKPFIYFYGEEAFLLDEAIQRLAKEAMGTLNDFNYVTYYGDETDPQEILNSADTLALGAKRRLVLVKRADSLSAKQLERFLPYFDKPNLQTLLVFRGDKKIDLRRKFFKKIDKNGALVEAKRLKGKDLKDWLHVLAKRRGHTLEKGACEHLEMLVGSSLHTQEQAIERLSLFLGENKAITTQAIREILADTHEGILWSLTDALAEGNSPQAFLALKRILRQKETSSAVLVIATLANFFRRLLYIHLAKEIGFSDQELCKKTQISMGALFFNKKIAFRFSKEKLKNALRHLSLADRRLKSSGLPGEIILYEVIFTILQGSKKENLLGRFFGTRGSFFRFSGRSL